MCRAWTRPVKVLGRWRGPLARPLASTGPVVRYVHPEPEPGDDAGVVPAGKVGIPRGDPGVLVLGVGDDVGKATRADPEDPGRLVVRVAVGVQACAPLRREDEVAGGELLFALGCPEDGASTEDEEHLLGPVVHVPAHAGRARLQLPQRGAHPGGLRAPEDALAQAVLLVLDVPGTVGEQVLTGHSSCLRSIAVAAERSARRAAAGRLARSERTASTP